MHEGGVTFLFESDRAHIVRRGRMVRRERRERAAAVSSPMLRMENSSVNAARSRGRGDVDGLCIPKFLRSC